MSSINDNNLEEHHPHQERVGNTSTTPESSLALETLNTTQDPSLEYEIHNPQIQHQESITISMESLTTPASQEFASQPESCSPATIASPETPITSPGKVAQHIAIDPEEECTICYSPFTTPYILSPCTHPFDSSCFLAWFDLHLSEIDTLFDRPPNDEILICPLCKQSVSSLTEIIPPTTISRDRNYIFGQALGMRYKRGALDPSDPVDDRCLRRFQNVSIAWGWTLHFGATEDLLTCRGKDIGVQDLVSRDRARGFAPIDGFDGEVVRAEAMGTVADVQAYLGFLGDLVCRNIVVDRQLNSWGWFGEDEGEVFEPDDLAEEFSAD